MLKYSEDNMKHVRDTDTTQLIFHEIYSGNMFRDTCGAPSRCSADATHIVSLSLGRRRKRAGRVKEIEITRE